jgi:hypothetical protein
MPLLEDLYTLTLAMYEGLPVALFPITDEDRAWYDAAVAYLERQPSKEDTPCVTSAP